MRITLVSIGKAHDRSMQAAIEDFTGRIGRYYPVQWQIIPPIKNSASLPGEELKKKEAQAVMNLLTNDDYLIALDEHGKQWTSKGLSDFLQQRAGHGTKNLVFLIGGAFGLDPAIVKSAKACWSLSNLTFPHHLVRLILAEQVYRACTIGRGERYHHE